jgi:NAD(P)H-dependent FMN reductase
MTTILGLSGSLRLGSINSALLRAAAAADAERGHAPVSRLPATRSGLSPPVYLTATLP